MEDIDELAGNKWFRALVVTALTASATSGFVNFDKDTSDRFKGADFYREIAERDQVIRANHATIRELEARLNTHLIHSAVYTEKINEHEREIARLFLKLKEVK